MKQTSPLFLRHLTIAFILGVILMSCAEEKSQLPVIDEQVFNAYWNQGKAEISSYDLSQSRYGAIHEGKAVMVFVTEDFSKSRHVKLDEPQKKKADAVKVLKLNMQKEFVTGIYPYHLMSSIFTPVDYHQYPHSFKLTSSTTDWCGQTFMQADWKGNRIEVQHYSYFESEGDSQMTLPNIFLEDEIWNKIRMAPHTLPVGSSKMIASSFYLRLSHEKNRAYRVETTLTKNDHYTYTIDYPELSRTMSIEFESIFPYRILGWKEVYGNNEVTTGRLMKTMMSDYWNHHFPDDKILRQELLLDENHDSTSQAQDSIISPN